MGELRITMVSTREGHPVSSESTEPPLCPYCGSQFDVQGYDAMGGYSCSHVCYPTEDQVTLLENRQLGLLEGEADPLLGPWPSEEGGE